VHNIVVGPSGCTKYLNRSSFLWSSNISFTGIYRKLYLRIIKLPVSTKNSTSEVPTMGTGSFPEVKPPRRGVDHPPPSSVEVKERVELYIYFPSGPSWPVLG
jgi:hypothetical protein